MSMEMNKALDLLHDLVSEVERKTCCHEETHRGGAIWEICDSCGAKWADDEGGKPEFAWPESVDKARAFLATHPAVEQAGGDERKLSDLGNELHNLSCAITHTNEEWAEQISSIARELWKWPDRAALAQPSPVPVGNLELARTLFEEMALIADDEKCIHMLAGALAQPSPKCATCGGTGMVDDGEITCSEGGIPYENGPVKCVKDCPDCKAQPSPAQAEAERPEVVARVVHSNPVVLGQCGPLNANDELMTVAQHAASVARWAEMFNRVEQQRDAALARVAELERKLRNEENAHTTTIEQRDNAEHWADQLANAIAERFGVDIGEHSNLNCPWNEALVWMQQPPAQAQHSVPEGWMLVPVEPTQAQLSAGQTAWLADPMRRSTTLYRAMLAATPQPVAEGE